MAQRFARLGCKLVLWDINCESNEQTAAELRQLNVDVRTYICDVANNDSVYHTANKVHWATAVSRTHYQFTYLLVSTT